MRTLLIATTNPNKVREIAAKLKGFGLPDTVFTDLTPYPAYTPPKEDGATFAKNARIKALAAAAMSGHAVLADDSGLTVAALGGAPGIYSARYAGAGHDDAANNAKLLKELEGVPHKDRKAAFCCAIALALPCGSIWQTEAQTEGIILTAPRGSGGFGYDPLFYLPAYGCSMAELSPQEKNRVSHRALALENALPLIMNNLFT
ncbi:MAG: RdgB/HAM1 family non-canonical purine NTP pyrophosphatase [Clostridiales bacterium]|nr:RdgB/HAM1 family non-canonical purine NTP pyrophosphatase [Clostridiales bacterium]